MGEIEEANKGKMGKNIYSEIRDKRNKKNHVLVLGSFSQQTFICPKSTIEHQKKAWNMFKINNKGKCKHQSDVIDVVPLFLLLPLNIFHTFF